MFYGVLSTDYLLVLYASRTVNPQFKIVTAYTIQKQSALVISNSKGLSEIHRDIRTSTYQISRIEKIKSNNQMPQIQM